MRLVIPMLQNQGVKQFEIKSFDHTCNPHIALAACLVYGIKGLKERLQLPTPYNDDADLLSD